MNKGPLEGIRVIEMGSILAGPFCGQILGDLGADVIKVEAPGQGDPMRVWGTEKTDGKALWWSILARNKRCVTIDCRVPGGQALIRKLVGEVDILLENFRPGTLEGWNLGYESLRELNRGLILVRVSGQGQTGPYRHRPGYGSVGEAMGGLRYVVGDPATPPSRMGISIGDSLAAAFACIGALSALRHRDQTGEGQVVDIAIYEAVLAVMETLVADYQQSGFIRERTGSILPHVAPSNVYPTKDGGMVLIAANQDTVFLRLAEAMGQPGLTEDSRYRDHAARGRHQAELDELIAAWSVTFDADDLVALMERHAVPVGQIYRAPEMLEDPHFLERESIVTVPHPEFGPLAMQNIVPRLSETPGEIRHCGPGLGEHTDEVLTELLGLTHNELEKLREDHII